MAEQFDVGDVVQLKSGGPIMTVSGISQLSSGGEAVRCQWFEKNKPMRGAFKAAMLKAVDL